MLTCGWAGATTCLHEAFPEARRCARRAWSATAPWFHAHAILGAVHLWYDWKWEDAFTEAERAVWLNPSEAGASLGLGWYFATSYQFEKYRKYGELSR